MSDNEEKTEAVADADPCPYGCEECSSAGRCDRCKADAFLADVTRLVLGAVPAVAVSEAVVLAELEVMIQKAKSAVKENTDLKAKNGSLNIQVSTLKAELTQSRQKERVGADIAIKASQALSKLQGVYGDDLSWDNIVDRAGGAVSRLQAQAPLMAAAEAELAEMRRRLADLDPQAAQEADGQSGRGGMPPLPEFRRPPFPGRSQGAPGGEGLEHRMDVLEGDLEFFRVIGRLGGRLLGLDSRRRKG